MKKYIISLLVAMVSCLGFSSQAFAASFAVSMAGNETFETSTTVTVSVGGYSGVGGYCNGICAVVMTLSYDSSKIAVVASPLNGFTLTSGTRLVLDRATGVPSGTAILSLNVTNVGLAAGESTTIRLTGISGSDSDVNATAASVQKTVTRKVSTPASKPESNTSNKTNTPAQSSTTTKPSNNTQAASNNNQNKAVEKSQETENTDEQKDESKESESSSEKEEKVVTITTEDRTDTSSEDAENIEEKTGLPFWAILLIIAAIVLIMLFVAFFFILKKKRGRKHSKK